MRCGIFAFAITVMLSANSAAPAATFSTAPADGGNVLVTLRGEITEGDSEKLNAIVQAAEDNGRGGALIRVASPGGGIREAAKLADTIRAEKIQTAVIGTAKCASACFIAFAAGSEKFANYTAS